MSGRVSLMYILVITLASVGIRAWHAGEKKNDSPAASGSGEPHQNLYANPTKLQFYSISCHCSMLVDDCTQSIGHGVNYSINEALFNLGSALQYKLLRNLIVSVSH